ncbi:MAG: hypothetical protein QMC83_01365 [Thermodesulfovibrionales bacterium]|nr:hypothetical protein [Thermodesulfovibrionales bacterium]
MAFEDVLCKYFDRVYTEVDFVQKTYNALKKIGFTGDNAIASVCVCRDEISQSVRSIIKHIWGEAFNLSSLAGMFFAGRTALMAEMHHAPVVEGKERYVYYALPHTATSPEGQIGVCKRKGREGESTACGALSAFQKEMATISSKLKVESLKLNNKIDNDDIEMSLIRMRLVKEIPYGHVPDLLELTKIAQKVIQADLENALKAIVDTKKCDYAVMTGIQINGPDGNYIAPVSTYGVVSGVRQEVNLI